MGARTPKAWQDERLQSLSSTQSFMAGAPSSKVLIPVRKLPAVAAGKALDGVTGIRNQQAVTPKSNQVPDLAGSGSHG